MEFFSGAGNSSTLIGFMETPYLLTQSNGLDFSSNRIEKNIQVKTSQHAHFHPIDDIGEQGTLFQKNFFNALFTRVAAKIRCKRVPVDADQSDMCDLRPERRPQDSTNDRSERHMKRW